MKKKMQEFIMKNGEGNETRIFGAREEKKEWGKKKEELADFFEN